MNKINTRSKWLQEFEEYYANKSNRRLKHKFIELPIQETWGYLISFAFERGYCLELHAMGKIWNGEWIASIFHEGKEMCITNGFLDEDVAMKWAANEFFKLGK